MLTLLMVKAPPMRIRLPLILLLGFFGAACHAPAQPDDAFRAFVGAVAAHQSDLAWNLISRDSQAAMTAAAQKVTASVPKGEFPTDPKAMLFGEDASLARPVTSLKVLDQSTDSAHVEVVTGTESHTVHMVREEGRWKLDLTEGLKL
jgi:hypothetical protein